MSHLELSLLFLELLNPLLLLVEFQFFDGAPLDVLHITGQILDYRM